MSRTLALMVDVLLAASACFHRETAPEPPANSHVAPDGSRWLRLETGTGRTGTASVWWSVGWIDVPCDSSDCQHVYNGRMDNPIYDRYRSNLLQMREGEVRRVWLPTAKGYAVCDVRLLRVFPTDVAGEPIVTNP